MAGAGWVWPPGDLLFRVISRAVDSSIGVQALEDAVRGEVAQDLPGTLLVDGVADLVERGDGALRVPLPALAGDCIGEAVLWLASSPCWWVATAV